MGQKVHPFGFRLGVIQNWSSRWFAKRDYVELLHKDLEIRRYLKRRLDKNEGEGRADVAKIDIERAGRKTKVIVFAGRPGLVIGQKGDRVEELRKELEMLTGQEVMLDIREVVMPDLCAQLVSERLALDLEKRVSFRRAMKKAMQNSMRLGAKGIRVRVSGRLNGAEIARTEQAREGSVPLHTLKANVDYGVATSYTTYGTIGVKCWIYLGDVASGERVPGLDDPARAGEGRRAERDSGRPRGDRGGRGGGGRGGGRGGRGGRGESSE